jgi:hypothetical protein
LAFTTTAGAAGVSLIGTSGVDVTELAPSSLVASIYIGAQAANDVVVVTASGEDLEANMGQGDDTFNANAAIELDASTVRGNDGDDTITFAVVSGLVDSFINGNAGDDTMSAGSIDATTIQGGAGDDTISVGGTVEPPVAPDPGVYTLAVDSLINGNKDDDTISVFGETDGLTVRGGQGDDTINSHLAQGAIEAFGDDGEDSIDTVNDFSDTLTGGDGVDTFILGANTNDLALGAPITTFSNFDIVTDFVAGTNGDTVVIADGAGFVNLGTLVDGVLGTDYAFGYVIGDTFTVSSGGSDLAIITGEAREFSASVLTGISSLDVLTANNFGIIA